MRLGGAGKVRCSGVRLGPVWSGAAGMERTITVRTGEIWSGEVGFLKNNKVEKQ